MHAHVSCVCDVCVTCVCVHNVFVSLHADKTVYVYLYYCMQVCVCGCVFAHTCSPILFNNCVGGCIRPCVCVCACVCVCTCMRVALVYV